MNKENIGNDYILFRRAQAHELGHMVDYEMLDRGEIDRNHYNSVYKSLGREDMIFNPYHYEVESFGRRMVDYSPAGTWFGSAFLPALLASSFPTAYDDRKNSNADFWRD
jgi:hypothetical protein